jgi:hypothetical protein
MRLAVTAAVVLITGKPFMSDDVLVIPSHHFKAGL